MEWIFKFTAKVMTNVYSTHEYLLINVIVQRQISCTWFAAIFIRTLIGKRAVDKNKINKKRPVTAALALSGFESQAPLLRFY